MNVLHTTPAILRAYTPEGRAYILSVINHWCPLDMSQVTARMMSMDTCVQVINDALGRINRTYGEPVVVHRFIRQMNSVPTAPPRVNYYGSPISMSWSTHLPEVHRQKCRLLISNTVPGGQWEGSDTEMTRILDDILSGKGPMKPMIQHYYDMAQIEIGKILANPPDPTGQEATEAYLTFMAELDTLIGEATPEKTRVVLRTAKK